MRIDWLKYSIKWLHYSIVEYNTIVKAKRHSEYKVNYIRSNALVIDAIDLSLLYITQMVATKAQSRIG